MCEIGLYFLLYIIEPSLNVINNTIFDSGLNYLLSVFHTSFVILPVLINQYIFISFLFLFENITSIYKKLKWSGSIISRL